MRPIVIILILLSNALNLNSQELRPIIPLREIVVQIGDTVVKSKTLTVTQKASLDVAKEYFWYGNGNIFSNYGACGGLLLHGAYSVFLNGKLISAGEFDRGLKVGTWMKWDGNGVLIESINWRKGILVVQRKSAKQPDQATLEKESKKRGIFKQKRKYSDNEIDNEA